MVTETWRYSYTTTTWDSGATIWDAIPADGNVAQTTWDSDKTTETWTEAT